MASMEGLRFRPFLRLEIIEHDSFRIDRARREVAAIGRPARTEQALGIERGKGIGVKERPHSQLDWLREALRKRPVDSRRA